MERAQTSSTAARSRVKGQNIGEQEVKAMMSHTGVGAMLQGSSMARCKSQADNSRLRAFQSKHLERRLSPEKAPMRLPNDDENYQKSPAARHAIKDGSLDERRSIFNSTFNRKFKMRDTFTKIFPTYNHAEPTTYNLKDRAVMSASHGFHQYPRFAIEGQPMYQINRQHTLKKDVMKNYHESMLRIQDMRRIIK